MVASKQSPSFDTWSEVPDSRQPTADTSSPTNFTPVKALVYNQFWPIFVEKDLLNLIGSDYVGWRMHFIRSENITLY